MVTTTDGPLNTHNIRTNTLAEAFRLDDAPTLVTRTLRKSTMMVTELRGDHPNHGITQSIPYDDAYLIGMMVRDCTDHDLYFDGRLLRPKNFVAGSTAIYDLKRDPIADLRSSFHSLHFYLPRKALDDITDEADAPRIDDLRYRPAVAMDDPVVRHLLSSLLPAMEKPEAACSVFVDHVALALTAHVAHAYGGMRAISHPRRGGLAPWQVHRATALLRENLSGEIPLSRLATECGLSVRHFSRAFRISTGVPPHRWLLKIRVERAKELLHNPTVPLADIALGCGFSDQSHFTRVFTAMVGVSPGAWRRIQEIRPISISVG